MHNTTILPGYFHAKTHKPSLLQLTAYLSALICVICVFSSVAMAYEEEDGSSELKRSYLKGGHNRPLSMPCSDNTDESGANGHLFEREIAYNLYLYHIVNNVGINCENEVATVTKVILDGVSCHDNNSRANIYYAVKTNHPRCPILSTQTQVERFADSDWYAPEWGARLVKR